MTDQIFIKDLRRQGFIKLENIQPDANLRSLEADLLLLHALNLEGAGREYLISNSLELVSINIHAIFDGLLKRRCLGEPISYILNRREFFGRDFYVDKRVLIPRSETESLVEIALSRITELNVPTNIIDIGTGSSCIIVSVLSELIEKGHSSLINRSFATDLSDDALKVAKINSSRLLPMEHQPRFFKADLLSTEVLKELSSDDPLVILANLPYIDVLDPETSSFVRDFEPSTALFSANEGRYHISQLLNQVSELSNTLKYKENKILLYLEVGYKQGNKVQFEANKIGFKSAIVHADLSGKDRIVECII